VLGRGSAEYGGPSFFWYTDEMDIKITYDPYEEAVNTGLVMGAHHKILPESEWLKHIKRETGRKDLFMYYHEYTEQYVLAHWIYPPWEVTKPVCLELESMPKAPDRGGWIPTYAIKLRCKPVDMEEQMLQRRLRSQADARNIDRKKREDIERKYESVAYLKRKGMESEALSLQNSKVHYSDSGSSELTEDLTNAAKGRIITNA